MWTLILFVYANMLANGDSVALTTTTFTNQKACMVAGDMASKMDKGTAKTIRYVCVENK